MATRKMDLILKVGRIFVFMIVVCNCFVIIRYNTRQTCLGNLIVFIEIKCFLKRLVRRIMIHRF